MFSRDCSALLQMPGCDSLLSRMISNTPVSPIPTILGREGRLASSGLRSDEESPQAPVAPPAAAPPAASSTSFHAAADCSWRMAAYIAVSGQLSGRPGLRTYMKHLTSYRFRLCS